MSGKGPKNQTTTSQAVVPEYLKPFVNNLASTGNSSLGNLSQTLNSTDPSTFVSPFNQNQLQGQATAVGLANGAGGILPDALNQIQGTVQGQGLQQNADAAADTLRNFATNGNPVLDSIANNSGLNQTAQNALQSTANGDHLYGGAGFNAALQASMRSARPQILSQFSQGGSGAVSGGLAQTAIQQAHADAFANLYNQERNRQVGAAQGLGGLSLQDNAIRSQAASLGGNQQLNAAGNIGSLLNQERNRQVQSAFGLPSLGLTGSNILNSVGNTQQNQAQTELSAPLNAQQQLFSNTLSGLGGIQGLLGQQTTQPIHRNTAGGILGGGMAGAGIAQALGASTPWGIGLAAAGGLLGGLS